MVTVVSKGAKRRRVNFISVFQVGYKAVKRLIPQPISLIPKHIKAPADSPLVS
jgi:hypothetical protein